MIRIPNTNNNTFNVDNNVINVVNINNKIIKKDSNKDKSEENKKSDDDNNFIEDKDKFDAEDPSNKKNYKLRRKRYSHNKNSSKLVFRSSKDVMVKFKIESDIHNLSKIQDESNNNSKNENHPKKSVEEKFKRRNNKRGGTHIHNLPEKLRGIEIARVFALISNNSSSKGSLKKQLFIFSLDETVIKSCK